MKHFLTIKQSQRGSITPALLVTTASFIIAIYGLLFGLTLQVDFSHRQTASEEGLHIAEAGINYYRWHLAHDPEDFQDGSGQPGPYEHEYLDPQGAATGKFSLEIDPPAQGSSIVTINSTGWSYEFPEIKRTIKAQYGKQSFAQFSFLQNASSWYGTNITVNGQVHSNNGIRMDGTNTSLVTSAKETYTCGSETGCSPPQEKPGVWGSGGDQGLWQFPIPPVDFDAVSFDFAQMKQDAQNGGLYLGPSESRGYHLLFSGDGTIRVNKVTGTRYYYGYSVEEGCQRLYQRINNETLVGTFNVSEVPIIFAEDYLWVEGVVNGRVTVVAARFPIESNKMNVWIPNNLTYEAYDDTNSLGLIAQNDIYYTKDIPNDFKIDAVLMAQKGKIIRHGYFWWCGGSSGAVKDKLTINGSIISFLKSYWNFGSGPSSGFRERIVNYDTNVLFAPPPYFPTSGEYQFISWTEE
jgi:hypothetical protein